MCQSMETCGSASLTSNIVVIILQANQMFVYWNIFCSSLYPCYLFTAWMFRYHVDISYSLQTLAPVDFRMWTTSWRRVHVSFVHHRPHPSVCWYMSNFKCSSRQTVASLIIGITVVLCCSLGDCASRLNLSSASLMNFLSALSPSSFPYLFVKDMSTCASVTSGLSMNLCDGLIGRIGPIDHY